MIDLATILLGPTPVRLHGIDAPEQGQRCNHPNGGTWPCGNLATEKLAELAEDRRPTCTVLDHDRYGRVIARCEVDGADLGAAIRGTSTAKEIGSTIPPGHPDTAAPPLNKAAGERWFCDEGEAVAAGWRAARWR